MEAAVKYMGLEDPIGENHLLEQAYTVLELQKIFVMGSH